MSMRPLRQLLIVAFAVSFSSLAFARSPAAHATQTSHGYRDLNWRFGVVGARSPEVMRAAGGYRDVNYRFPMTRF
jgi:hypothetical protein